MRKRSPNHTLLIIGLVVLIAVTPLSALFGPPIIAPLFCDQSGYLLSVCNSIAILFYGYPIAIVTPLIIGATLILISVLKKNK